MKYVNPLLDLSGLPRFEEIEAHHVEPALDEVLATNREQISALESHADIADWTSFARPLEDLDERLQRVWSPVSHLNAVVDSDALILLICNMAERLYPRIRQLISSNEPDEKKDARWNDLSNRFTDLIEERFNPRRVAVKRMKNYNYTTC